MARVVAAATEADPSWGRAQVGAGLLRLTALPRAGPLLREMGAAGEGLAVSGRLLRLEPFSGSRPLGRLGRGPS